MWGAGGARTAGCPSGAGAAAGLDLADLCDLAGLRRCAECLAGACKSEPLWKRLGLLERIPASRRHLRAHSCPGQRVSGALGPQLALRSRLFQCEGPVRRSQGAGECLSGRRRQGWRCDREYREANGACVAVQIPVNARSSGSSYGSGWECKRGFRVEGAQCLAVVIPARGFLGQFRGHLGMRARLRERRGCMSRRATPGQCPFRLFGQRLGLRRRISQAQIPL